ncbi:hypothetical protein [Priestia aryabhattai]|uniref:hypothetical protein n=1 Tax=Priestia aryabhattai TaxID=412384 RepID=UPI001CCB8705|nr:hypothetical protein [Priestia aryabhattai]MBZ6485091.1 hypothetical protein [Priestia aryabhattai]
MSRYEDYILKIFSSEDVYKTGNELNNMLQREFGITSPNSRKVISRVCDKNLIRSSKPITFGNGQYVYFKNSTNLNINVVKKITRENRPPVYHLLNLLESSEGIISYYEGLKVTASPIKKEKEKSSTLGEILSMLIALNLVEITNDRGITYIVLSKYKDDSLYLMKNHRRKMDLDCMFIPDIKNWLVKHNFIDNNYIVYRNKSLPTKGAEHNNYVWDAYAYTNTTGYNTLLENNKERDDKKTLVVLDIIVNRTYMSCDVQGFLRRVQAVRSSSKMTRKLLPIVVYQEITSHAYSQLKKLGFIMLNLGTVYGANIYPIIQSVKDIKSEIRSEGHLLSEEIIGNVEYTLSKMNDSGQIDNLGNLKGDLFESLMYTVVKRLHNDSSIEQGKVLRRKNPDGSSEYYEYDLIVRDYRNEEIIIYEFKGYNSTKVIPLKPYDKPNTVKWFFNKTLPFAREELKKQSIFPVKGCYITTATFSEEALKVLKNLNTHKNIKPETHDVYYDGEKLISLLTKLRENHTIEILKKYFIKLHKIQPEENLDSLEDIEDCPF